MLSSLTLQPQHYANNHHKPACPKFHSKPQTQQALPFRILRMLLLHPSSASIATLYPPLVAALRLRRCPWQPSAWDWSYWLYFVGNGAQNLYKVQSCLSFLLGMSGLPIPARPRILVLLSVGCHLKLAFWRLWSLVWDSHWARRLCAPFLSQFLVWLPDCNWRVPLSCS